MSEQEVRVSSLEKQYDKVMERLDLMDNKVSMKLDLISQSLNRVNILETKQDYVEDKVQDVIERLEKLEDYNNELAQFQHRTEGMAKMIWILWSVFGVSLVTILIKIFYLGLPTC